MSAYIEFLDLVLPTTGWSAVVAIHPNGGECVGLGVSRETLAEIEPWVEQHREWNLYWSPNSPEKRLNKKPLKKNIAYMRWVHLDFDDSRPEALAALRDYRAPPTLIIFSGGGYQAFWLLREPVYVNGNIEVLEAANRRVLMDLDPAHPGTHNLDRIMRLAGTTNWPTKTKLAKGRVPIEAALIEAHMERVYSLEDFPAPTPAAAGSEKKATHTAPRVGKKSVDQSALLLSAIMKDYLAGVTVEEIRADYMDHPHVLGKPNDAEKFRAIDRCIEKAKAAAALRDEAAEKMNKKHALVWVGNQLSVMWLQQWNGPLPRLASVADMKTQYANQHWYDFEDWLESPGRAEYSKIVFEPPGGPTTSGAFNLWRGFAVESRKGDCKRFLKFVLECICSSDEDLYRYVTGWAADLIQSPASRPGISLVLRGKPGTGKGTFAHALGSLLGDHYVYVSRSEHVVGKFNAHLATGLLLFADEALFAGDRSTEGVLKSLITEDELPVEPKFRDVMRIKNHIRLLMASNQDWVVSAAMDDRRLAIIDVDPMRANDTDYFGAIKKELNNGGREALLYHLQHYDMTRIDLRKIPKTEARVDQQIRSLDTERGWWLDMLQKDSHEAVPYGKSNWAFGFVVEPKTLHESYLHHCDVMKVNHRLTQTQFGIKMVRDFLPDVEKREVTADEARKFNIEARKRVYLLPTLEAARKQFDALVGRPMTWPADPETGGEM